MVAREAETVGGGERREVGRAIEITIDRTGNGRLKRTRITKPGGTPKLREVFIVNGKDELGREPNWLRHFASSRRAF
jgi:hypothetical protein